MSCSVDIYRIAQTQPVVVDVLRAQEDNSAWLISLFAASWRTTRARFGADPSKCAPCPAGREAERGIVRKDWTFKRSLLDFPRLHEPCLLRCDPLHQFRCWFIVRILLHQLAAHGEAEDGLAQGLDLVGTGGERGKVFEGETGVVPEYGRVGIGRIEAGEDRPLQPCPASSPVASVIPPTDRRAPSVHQPWQRYGAVRREGGEELPD